MRFDLLLAVFSSGLWAPLALMAFGFVLAVGGGIFLWHRRKKPAQRASEPRVPAEEVAAEDGAQIADERVELAQAPNSGSAPPPAVAGGRRRRSLVGGAERDEGTPSGEARPESLEETPPDETEEPAELVQPAIEEAEFTEYGEAEANDEGENYNLDNAGSDDGTVVDEIQAEDIHEEPVLTADHDEREAELDPEWIEPVEEISKEPEVEDMSLEAIAAAAGVSLATGTAAMAVSGQEDDTSSDESEHSEEANHDAGDDTDVDELPKTPIPAELMGALSRPIVFRQFLPQSPGKDGLSFYGGTPVGPTDFQWPRERGAQGGAPLQFVMQWDCAQLAEIDPTGLLPLDGVLYCFINCDRNVGEDYLASHTFIHHRGSVQAWGPIATPDDAGPALGKLGTFELSGCTDAVENAVQFVPRQLPRFPFAPIAFAHPVSDANGDIFWSDEKAASALLDVQNSGIAVREEANRAADEYQDRGRPFPAFPHDFGAIRVLASRMIEALESPDEFLAETLYPSLSVEERNQQFAGWREEAKEIFLLGTQRSPDQKLDQNIADDIWQWVEERKGVLDTRFPELVEEAVDLSLSCDSEALANVPSQWIDRAMQRHALATQCEHRHDTTDAHIRTVTPARMFGPATAAPAVEDLARDHILLLELPSEGGPGHHFGGKTLQYWITADDLANGSFDAVKSVVLEPAA